MTAACDNNDDDKKNTIVPQNNTEINNTDNTNNDNNNITQINNEIADSTYERWISSQNLELSINQFNQDNIFLTNGFNDYKPVWNVEASKITFFRHIDGHVDIPDQWKTKLCIINADGTGFKELTDGTYADLNPTWTRDGSNKIIMNRFSLENYEHGVSMKNDIYLVSTAGEMELISDPFYEYFEWAFSGLVDGRILVDKCEIITTHSCSTFLLRKKSGEDGIYEEITRPTDKLWHKLSLSPDETKVTYMLDEGSHMGSYEDCAIYIADFNKETLTISNQKAISVLNTSYIDEYPRWNEDSTIVAYDSNRSGTFQIYAYRLSDGVTKRISPDAEQNYRFMNFEGVPK